MSKVDYTIVFKEIWKRKKLFFITIPLTFILSYLYIICVPRLYVSETKVAPEVESPAQSGMLGNIASSFGLDLSNMESSDAITPLIYPELLEDNNFIAGLSDIKVESQDGLINTTFNNYIEKHQKYPWWTYCIGWIKNKFTSAPQEKTTQGKYDPYILSKKENDVLEGMRNTIKLNVDKKTGVITINTEAQDALICKCLADSVREHLQKFIIKYRTNKARTDYEYYKKLTAEAKRDYERSRQRYAAFSDSNTDVTLQSIKSKQEDMENDMQLKFNTYSTLQTQMQVSRAKIQERTPAFTLVKGASMPIKASSPKRMFFVLVMTFLAFMCTSVYVLKDIIKD